MKKLNILQFISVALCLSSASILADDTEIYFGVPAAEDAVPPFVMLSLDWRSNLGSSQCDYDSDPAISNCDEAMGDEIYGALVDEGRLQNGDDVTLFDAYRGVLRVVFNEIEDDGFSIGFMMSHENENNCNATHGDLNNDKGCSNGGFILRGFDVVDGTAAGQASKEELLDIMAEIPVPQGNLAHPYQGRELFFEFFRYLMGGEVLNGHKGWSDFGSDTKQGKGHYNLDQEYTSGTGGGSATSGNGNCDFDTDRGCENTTLPNNVDPNENSDGIISPWTTWDMDIDDGDDYTSPYTVGDYSCSKTYTINFMFQVSQQDADSNTEASSDIGNAANEQGLELANTSGNNAFPEIISKLHTMDHASADVGVDIEGNQNVTSYFIVENINTKTRAYAEAGGTETPIEASTNPELLLDTLRNIFNSILSVSTTFTAASVPVNVQNRTEALPDMYLALFKVDPDGYPLWPGNVKKLTIDTELLSDGSTATTIVDEVGSLAFNPITGQISDSALTIWTDHTALDVITADTSIGEVSAKDGSSITRGGSGHMLPGYRVDAGGTPKTSDPTAANTTPSVAGDSDGRQLFVSPSTVDGHLNVGNALLPLDADSVAVGSLAADTDIQKLLGVLIEDVLNPGDYINDAAYIAQIESNAGEDFSALTDAESRAASAQILLKWVRGIDVFDWDGDTEFDDARPWMMGDPLHSRPLTMNYGPLDSYTDDNQHIRVLFGTSDGFLHSLRNTLANGDESGVEEWGFMPRELLAHVKDLTKRSFVGEDKPYGIDLPPISFTIDNDHDGIIERGSGGNDSFCAPGGDDDSDPTDLNCDKAYVYVGLRRGGKSYYGLDISDPEDEPRLLWQITNEGVGTDFEQLGMSFSTPRQAWVRFETDANSGGKLNTYLGENVPVPVLIFGGGLYGGWTADRSGRVGRDDLSYDVTTDAVDGHDPEGAAVFIVHARTGEVIWKAVWGAAEGGVSANEYRHDELIHSIPAAVTPIDSNGNGITDRIYVGDTGGNVWRFELPEFNPLHDATDTNYHDNFREDYWRATKLAELGGSVGSTADRRFYHGLSVVQGIDAIGRYDGIAIGSGDRAHPQSAPSTIENKYFLIKDREIYADADLTASTGVDGRTPLVIGDLFDVTSSCINDSNSDSDASNQCSAANLTNGWKLDLAETGEKNLSIPLISDGNINFTTYLPEGGESDGDCSVSLGISRLYQVAVRDGSPDIHLHSHLQGDTLQASDRYLDLAAGIDGGVTAVSPNTGLAGGSQVKLGDQRPNTYFWREINVDVLHE